MEIPHVIKPETFADSTTQSRRDTRSSVEQAREALDNNTFEPEISTVKIWNPFTWF